MSFEARLVVGLLMAGAAVYAATPLAIRVAARFNFYDRPAGYKGHARPTPYLGGLAVVGGFTVVLLAIAAGAADKTFPLLGGMALLWAVGTVDDRLNISPWPRVAVELGLGWFLWRVGLGWHIGLGGAVDLILTATWLVAVINAINLFDNMDGTASAMTLAVAACVVALGLIQGNEWLSLAAAVLCGACLGFLPHNLATPARIFLGDGGSMPLGFAAATLVMVGAAQAAPAWQSLVLGLLLVGVPATDTTLVILSRRRRGIGVLTGGRDHITHRTRRWLPTARAVALALGAVQALLSAIAIFAIRGGATAFLVIAVLYLVAMATAISFLEAHHDEAAALAVAPGTRRLRLRLDDIRSLRNAHLALIVVFAGIAGGSALSSGFYSSHQWVPIGLVLLTAATAGVIARPPTLSRTHVAALVGMGGMGLWGLASSLWAPSIAEATLDANRWLVLAAIFATALVLVRSDRSAEWMTAGLGLGILVVAGVVVVRLLGSDPSTLFLTGRLNQPMGYVNAEGTTFVMGFWLWFSLIERRSAAIAGLGLTVATTMAGIALLSQSRGAALAMLVAVAVAVGVLPGNRLRRAYALLLAGAAIAVAGGPLLDVFTANAATGTAHHATLTLLVASVIAGLLWVGGVRLAESWTEARPALAAQVRRAGVAVLVLGALAVGGWAIVSAGSIGHYASRQYDAFVHLSEPAEGTSSQATTERLFSGAGNRYDYWRIALDAFVAHPLDGVGAGNYDRPYFKDRHTTEDVRQPHSLELQALSELGIVGGLLVVAFLGALAAGIWRARRFVGTHRGAMLSVAGAGVVVTWMVHTSVDWIHLFPGITAIALAMAVVLLRHDGTLRPRKTAPEGAGGRLRPRTRVVVIAGGASLALVIALASLGREGLADLFRDRAQNALANNPAAAIREADRSLRLDSETPETYYVKAAALSRFNRAEEARSTLLQAVSKEPDNFVTWTLLGDLAVRRGRFGEAQRDYRRALTFNPSDPSLKTLAENPRSALTPTP